MSKLEELTRPIIGIDNRTAQEVFDIMRDRITAALAVLPDLAAENERLRAALTPSAETKAAYIGEFRFKIEDRDEDWEECFRDVTVPWTTIKEIMNSIRDHAALERNP